MRCSKAAVSSYWNVRQSQADKSRALGVLNTGTRAEVTGGRHLDELHSLLVRVFIDAGIPSNLIEVKKRPIPGYFRRDKSWDVVVTVEGRVVGIIELKSMVGNMPGQNYNNRTDEALGQAIDVWKAVERNIIDTPLRPGSDTSCCLRTISLQTARWCPEALFGRLTLLSTDRPTPSDTKCSSSAWSGSGYLMPPASSWHGRTMEPSDALVRRYPSRASLRAFTVAACNSSPRTLICGGTTN